MFGEKDRIVTEGKVKNCKNFQWQLHKYRNKRNRKMKTKKIVVAVDVICKSFANIGKNSQQETATFQWFLLMM